MRRSCGDAKRCEGALHCTIAQNLDRAIRRPVYFTKIWVKLGHLDIGQCMVEIRYYYYLISTMGQWVKTENLKKKPWMENLFVM